MSVASLPTWFTITEAAEHAKLKSGLGPLDPDGDPRSPKPLSTSIQPVKPEARPSA